MAARFLLLYAIAMIFVYADCTLANPDAAASKPNFAFGWLDDKDTYVAGDTATIRIIVLGSFDSYASKRAFGPSVTVNGKLGNSTFITRLCFNLAGDPGSWSISFIPILVGVYNVLILEDHFGVLDSSLHFTVNPGHMNPAMSTTSWTDSVNEFVAGTRATALVLPKDAFGNKVPSTVTELNSYVFHVSASFHNGSVADVLSVTSLGWNHYGFLRIEFIAATAGDLLLHIKEGIDQYFQGSPLPFKVKPGMVDTSKCFANWKFNSNVLQLFSLTEVFIHQLDAFRNLVPGLYPLDAEVTQEGTNLSMPVADLRFEEVSHGVQLLTFTALEPGDFLLMIYDAKNNRSIDSMQYKFTVFVGYCDEVNSVINGSGLNTSSAGQEARFSVHLLDKYQYPSPVELQRLQIQIIKENSSYSVTPSISSAETSRGSGNPWKAHESVSHEEVAPQSPFEYSNASAGNSTLPSHAYNVIYTPEKSGIYDICVLCGNILLNGGHPVKKEVKAGDVNISLSAVVRYAPRVQRKVKNEIVISLLDSFSNPVLSQESKLKLEIGSGNQSAIATSMFLDKKDGSYTGYYLVQDVGTQELCASYDGNHLSPCPFEVNVYNREYFPKACDDSLSVWEDESAELDVLGNDYFAGENATIVEFSYPRHGSILRNGQHFRYTPHKEFYGNDSFTYSISDVSGNVAAASVNISILSIPPQFVAFPAQMEAVENLLSPRFGGFRGFEITYPDQLENISVTLSARSGTVSLHPALLTFWQPSWNGFSVSKVGEEARDLMITGRVEMINVLLQSIQYLGNENFFGVDVIRVAVKNANGVNEVNVTVSVDPINDPPYVRAPEYIILEEKGDGGKGSLIHHKGKDKFVFEIGDPDYPNFPGDKSQFLLMLSAEVDKGSLEATLPAKLINTTELKRKSSYHWQPLQTYISISMHFMVKAKGVRFIGTLDDCNDVIQLLKFHGEEDGAVLTLAVNDLGNYGCHAECAENVSRPLFAQANINLIYRRPDSSLAAYVLGAVIIIELIMVLAFGVILLSFTCKCVTSLIGRRGTRKDKTPETQTEGENKCCLGFDRVASLAGCLQRSPVSCGEGPSRSSQRLKRQPSGGSPDENSHSSPSGDDSSGHPESVTSGGDSSGHPESVTR